ncbi:hypothetical protein BX286_6305 [Streptomyces sp. 3211.6]|nr:hypothetical protein BX286_6305 [Streptomyces sp. 3211.6]
MVGSLIMRHRRACLDLASCRDAGVLADGLDGAELGQPSGIWLLIDASSDWVAAAAHAEARLNADGVGQLLVRGLVTDPGREGDLPCELMASWLTHWASGRPAAVREVVFRVDCPLAQARGRGRAVLRQEVLRVDGRVQQIDVRAPQELPSLAAMVSTEAELPGGASFEVVPARVADRPALDSFLQQTGDGGRPEDYTRARSQASGRLLLTGGRLTAAFTARRHIQAAARGSGVAVEKPALRLEQLRITTGSHQTLGWLTAWADSHAAHWHLRVLEMPVTGRHLVSPLMDLGWGVARIRSTPIGLEWVMQRRRNPTSMSHGSGTT